MTHTTEDAGREMHWQNLVRVKAVFDFSDGGEEPTTEQESGIIGHPYSECAKHHRMREQAHGATG